MFIHSYLQTAAHLIEQYDLQMPLHLYLKQFFKQNRKFGSRDRKMIAELVYGNFRIGYCNQQLSLTDTMLAGAFLHGKILPDLLAQIKPTWIAFFKSDFLTKKKFLETQGYQFVLPAKLTKGIDEHTYWTYIFQQAKVFVRIRNNPESYIYQFKKNKVNFEIISPTCVAFDVQISVESLFPIEQDYVIQDYSSQQVGQFFTPQHHEQWWDCCAASGGKSILLLDTFKKIKLTVSDIRPSILKNLQQRLARYQFRQTIDSLVIDLTDPLYNFQHSFHQIICDAPCSGGGTWNRSPEQLYFCTPDKLNKFHHTQLKILQHIAQNVVPQGKIYYITCSVWAIENEEVIDAFLSTNNYFEKLHQQLICGTAVGADHLFISILQKK